MTWDTPISGHCSCNRCTYTIDPNIPTARKAPFPDGSIFKGVYDHCTDCRRATSSLACAWLIIPTEWLVWSTSSPSSSSSSALKTYVKGDTERTFCGECGTSLTFFNRAKNVHVDVTIASLSEDVLARLSELGLEPAAHFRWSSGVPAVKEGVVAANKVLAFDKVGDTWQRVHV